MLYEHYTLLCHLVQQTTYTWNRIGSNDKNKNNRSQSAAATNIRFEL